MGIYRNRGLDVVSRRLKKPEFLEEWETNAATPCDVESPEVGLGKDS